jgi:hypothetical protein
MTFENYLANAQTIFKSFPNQDVWLQGGLKPNRQVQNPEAGYCVVLRYDQETTTALVRFMSKIQAVLPPILEYTQRNLHTTIGVYGKGDMRGFTPDPAALQNLAKSIEQGINNHPQGPLIELGQWLFNDEAMLVSGYPNQALWQIFQNIGNACQKNGHALKMGRIVHITTARFISAVTRPMFEQFANMMESAPVLGPVRPCGIDLAVWRCDGLTFEIITHQRYNL